MKKEKVSPGIALPELKDWHAIAIIVALVAIFFRDILLKEAFFWEDFIYQFYPFRNFAAVSMAHGQLPLWNPYTFSGTPFQADIQSALFYIPNLLLTFFVSGDRLSYYWVELLVIAHIAIAGITMYYLVKDFGVHRVYALFSSVIFSLSGFMITHTIHLVMISQVAWLPLILLLFRKALRQKSTLFMILAGLVLGHAVLAGFPQLSLYIFFFLFLYFVFEFVVALKRQGFTSTLPYIPIAIGMIVIAIALTAIQILPTLELAPLSQRAEITFTKSLEGMLSWNQLITMIVPKYFGSSGAQGASYFGPGQYWAYWETCFYLGIPALIFIAFSISQWKENRYVPFFFLIGVFSILYALGDGFIFHKFFFDFIPGFDKFRSIGRMTLLWTFSGAILSAFGLRAVVEMVQAQNSKGNKLLIAIALATGIVWMIGQFDILSPASSRQPNGAIHPVIMGETITALILIAVTIGAVVFFSRKIISGVVAMALLLALQFVDMNIFGFSQNNGSINPEDYYNRTAQVVDLLKRDGDKEYFRINSRIGGAMILDRNQGMVDQIFMMEGYTPLVLQRVYPPASSWDRTCDLLNAKYRIVVDEKQRRIDLTSVGTYLPRGYLVYHSQVLSDEKQLKEAMEKPDFDPRQTILLEEDPGFRTDTISAGMQGNVKITSYSLNSLTLTVSTQRNAFLVLSEIFYPGWNAYIDGQRRTIYRADWSLRAVPIEAGDHQVEIRFEPVSFHRGMQITIGTIFLSIIGIVFSVRKKK
jgi:hypothetical protein